MIISDHMRRGTWPGNINDCMWKECEFCMGGAMRLVSIDVLEMDFISEYAALDSEFHGLEVVGCEQHDEGRQGRIRIVTTTGVNANSSMMDYNKHPWKYAIHP